MNEQSIRMYAEYEKARDMIYTLTEERLEQVQSFNLSYKACLNEHGTLNLDFGRQTGSSYWARKMLLQERSSLLLYPNSDPARHTIDNYPEFRPSKHRIVSLSRWSEVKEFAVSNLTIRLIMVDCHFMLDDKTKNNLGVLLKRLEPSMLIYL